MQTTFCFDFGNTRLKAAVFNGFELINTIALNDDLSAHIHELLNTYRPQFSILSSVIDHDEEIEYLLKEKTDFHKLTHLSNLPFTIPVGKPETVGADRLAIAASAVQLYPQQNSLMIALGSCVTYNFINTQHQLIGGSISPGMEMRFKALNQYTAKLPLVKGDWNVPLIGFDTMTNIQSGVVLGVVSEIEGIISLYEQRFSKFNAVLTGGDLPLVVPHLKREIFADPELIFKGLYAISAINHA
jgi:type III pantothenate kinase